MYDIEVNYGGSSYRVHGERGTLARTGSLLREAAPEARRAVIVTDEHVKPLYLKALAPALEHAAFMVRSVAVPAGDDAKNLDQLARLYREFAAAVVSRSDVVVALGGGSVSDVAGFAAATFKHGVPWAIVPTTLLAQLELCLGGDVGIDVDGLKNQVGTFHQPRAVIIDGELLATLPAKHVSAGLAEAVKYGVLGGEEAFAYLEDNAPLLTRAGPELDVVVERGLRYKASVLASRERGRGEGHLLDLGRTLGRAFESAGRLSLGHGEALAIGLVYTALLSELRGEIATEAVIRIAALLRRFNLPTYLPTLNLDKTLEALVAGKPTAGSEIYVAMPRDVGQVVVEPIAVRTVAELLPQIHRLARSMT